MKILSLMFLMSVAVVAAAASGPYNETADAKLDIKQALAASPTNAPVLVVFGANWCEDCAALDAAMKHGASAKLLAKDFKIVKVDVGHLDKNEDVAKSYGVPLEKGIPTVVILSPKNEALYVTKQGELASAKSMGEDGIYQFFKKVKASSAQKP